MPFNYSYEWRRLTFDSIVQPFAFGSSWWQNQASWDADRGKLVFYGIGSQPNETWEWDAATLQWGQRFPATTPGDKIYSALIYDEHRQVTVMAQGRGGTFDVTPGFENYSNEFWEWDGTDWTHCVPSVYPDWRHSQHSLSYDPVTQQVYMHGAAIWLFFDGIFDHAAGEDGIWSYTGAGNPCVHVKPSAYHYATTLAGWFPFFGPYVDIQYGIFGEAMAFDPVLGKLVKYSGYHWNEAGTSTNDGTNRTWTWSGGSPTVTEINIPFTGPDRPFGYKRYESKAAYMEREDRVVFFGGARWNQSVGGGDTYDLWAYDRVNLAWEELVPTNVATFHPEPMRPILVFWDNVNNRYTVLGSTRTSGGGNLHFFDIWTLDMTSIGAAYITSFDDVVFPQ